MLKWWTLFWTTSRNDVNCRINNTQFISETTYEPTPDFYSTEQHERRIACVEEIQDGVKHERYRSGTT